MTHHQIAGSEAFDARRRITVQELPTRRRTSPWVWAAVSGWAVAIVLADLHLGGPFCLLATLGALAAAYFWRLA